MGVPKFYRWLSERYPLINQLIVEDEMVLPEFDAMYLDANGIIHTCTHANGEEFSLKHISIVEMVGNIFYYISEMVRKIKPKSVLFIAIDGCAPRAKMNQQRSRRFASARDRREKNREKELTYDQVRDQFDSNCITPGTEFMQDISRYLHYLIRMKILSDPLWKNLRVYYSGHDVPGEGEHKIMDFIRSQRLLPGYNPNTRHCLCGLDADLIMLGLASHEAHFCLLREVVEFPKFEGGRIKQSSRDSGGTGTRAIKKQVTRQDWQLLHLSMLRKYFDIEFGSVTVTHPNFKYNLESVIDDLVTLLALVGNDFLPHSPTLKINEGALDRLFSIYKRELPINGYITEGGSINYGRLESIFKKIGENEKEVFEAREQKEKEFEEKQRGIVPDAITYEFEDENEDSDTSEVDDIAPTADFKVAYYKSRFSIDVRTLEGKNILERICKSYLEGIWFCHQYYFEGVDQTSWVWFYPFHYAPLISDMVNLSNYLPIQIQIGEPFSPFIQLLGCLPADSAPLLPKSYQWLMTSSESPIRDFYPMDFQVDMAGARHAHEGVSLLPFIDEARLKAAVEKFSPDSSLSEEERNRNRFGDAHVFSYDSAQRYTYRSPLPNYYKNLDKCNVRVESFSITLGSGLAKSFRVHQLPGVALTAGDPQVDILGLNRKECKLGRIRVFMFTYPSKNETLVISQADQTKAGNAPSSAQEFIQTLYKEQRGIHVVPTVWVNYPYLQQAAVISVADDRERYTLNNARNLLFTEEDLQKYKSDNIMIQNADWTFSGQTISTEDAKKVNSLYQYKLNELLSGSGSLKTPGGIDLNKESACMVEVVLLRKNFTIQTTGQQIHCFTSPSKPFLYPKQTVFFKNSLQDHRLLIRPSQTFAERFPTGSPFICIREDRYCMAGVIQGHVLDASNPYTGMLQVNLQFEAKKNNTFARHIVERVKEKFMSAAECASKLMISVKLFEYLVSSFLLREGHDIGLNLFVKGHYVPGYLLPSPKAVKPWLEDSKTPYQSIRADGSYPFHVDDWMFSNKAIELIELYKAKFKSLFEILANPQNFKLQFNEKQLFKDVSELEKVKKWLSQLKPGELVPTSSTVLSPLAVNTLLASLSKLSEFLVTTQEETIVHPKDVIFENKYRPYLHGPKESLQLGDRVVSIGNNGVPFALRGTVIGVHPNALLADILFDVEFSGGNSLAGLCPPMRGKRVAQDTLLPLEMPVRTVQASQTFVPPSEEKIEQKASASQAVETPRKVEKASTPKPTEGAKVEASIDKSKLSAREYLELLKSKVSAPKAAASTSTPAPAPAPVSAAKPQEPNTKTPSTSSKAASSSKPRQTSSNGESAESKKPVQASVAKTEKRSNTPTVSAEKPATPTPAALADSQKSKKQPVILTKPQTAQPISKPTPEPVAVNATPEPPAPKEAAVAAPPPTPVVVAKEPVSTPTLIAPPPISAMQTPVVAPKPQSKKIDIFNSLVNRAIEAEEEDDDDEDDE